MTTVITESAGKEVERDQRPEGAGVSDFVHFVPFSFYIKAGN